MGPREPLLTRPLPALLLISLLAALIYSNTFPASFHFDDAHNIVENPKIKHLSNFLDLSGTRYVGFLTFALNYHFGGLAVFGYHLFNLLIHITNGFLVYSLVLLLFRASSHSSQPSTFNPQLSTAPWIALTTALLFISHPLQTQAVTYIVQRFASLAALFYLLTVVAYLNYRLALPESRNRFLWYGMALLSTILAMKTKEISFTLPFMLLLIEAVFFAPISKKNWISLVPFLLTLLIIPLSRVDAVGEAEGGFAQETTKISRGDYLFTQFRVIVTYIRLLFLPIHQNLDYDYPIYHSLFDPPVFFSFLLLLALLGSALYLLFSSRLPLHPSRLTAFGILWFFLTLSMESSIIPIRDVIFEHRLYLPSAGFFLACIMGALEVLKTRFYYHLSPITYYLVFSFIVISLSFATYQRNRVWNDGLTLWQDVVGKAPNKVRGHNNLGNEYQVQGRLDEAIREYQTALQIQPDYVRAHNNLGLAYSHQGRLEEAIQKYHTALQIQPDYAETHNNLGSAYLAEGRLEEAIREFQTALQLQPNYAEAHNNLGLAYSNQGRLEEAIREYQTALQIQPDYAEIHYNLGLAYSDQGRLEEAIRAYQTVLQLQPDYVRAHNNLGLAYSNQGRLEEAIREYQIALQLQPNYAEAHNNLGLAYSNQGRLEEAIREYQTALQLQPNLADVHYNLGLAYRNKGMLQAARSEFEQALKVNPDYLPARQALESSSK